VRGSAADALGTAFSHVPDASKDQAWQDLIRLTKDEDRSVRGSAAYALGTAFSHVPDASKDQAWQDLIRLTKDEDSHVRGSAYHSLGRASVFKATETADKDALKKELENAIIYFEKSLQESTYSPARFCHPFYCTYFAITFQEAKEEEVEKYLAEAKVAVGGSESKDELLKAVENLAGALRESQRLKMRSFQEVASELNTYRWYCEKAADHMAAAEDKAPGATKLLRKCNSLIEEKIQITIKEIQEKARQICQTTRGSGTEFEAPGVEINRAAKALSSEDIHKTQRNIIGIIFQLKEFCRLLPEGKREFVCGVIEEIELATEFPDKLCNIELALSYVNSDVKAALKSDDDKSNTKQVLTKLEVMNGKLDKINGKLDEIRYSVFKQRISFGNAISNLTAMKMELEKLRQIALQHPNSSLKELYSCREEQLLELSRDMDNRFSELKDVIGGKTSADDIKMILDKLEKLKPVETRTSKVWNVADKGATLLTYISFLGEVITVLKPG
jgi:hypothetical protein